MCARTGSTNLLTVSVGRTNCTEAYVVQDRDELKNNFYSGVLKNLKHREMLFNVIFIVKRQLFS